MEASAQATAPAAATRSRPTDLLREAGDMAAFSGRAMMLVIFAGRHFAEVLRQSSLLVTGTTALMFALVFVVGSECGLFVVYLLRSVGASSFAGFNTAICDVREMWPYMFGYVYAAKVGCGLVAEIGSMKINEEIDAMESVGIDPNRYVVATRLLATWMTVPLMYLGAMVLGFLGSYLVVVIQYGEVSPGQYTSLFWSSHTLVEYVYSLGKVMAMATVIALVGMYYGLRARGGPVGVGAATARSMVVNMVLIHVVGGVMSVILFSGNDRVPIGG